MERIIIFFGGKVDGENQHFNFLDVVIMSDGDPKYTWAKEPYEIGRCRF